MAARKKKSLINLLPEKEFAGSTLGRVLAWLLSTFRYIVILTEVVVIAAFISRFWLDAKTTDLNDAIKQKQAIISATLDFEKKFKDIQEKLNIYDQLTRAEVIPSALISTVASYLPPEAFLSTLNMTERQIQIKGRSFTERAIAQFIANLESSEKFSKVSLTQVGTDEQNISLMVFNITLTLKGG